MKTPPVASTAANSQTAPEQSIDENKLRRTITFLDELSRITATGDGGDDAGM